MSVSKWILMDMSLGEPYLAPRGERLGYFGNVLVTSRFTKTVAEGTLSTFPWSFTPVLCSRSWFLLQSVRVVGRQEDLMVLAKTVYEAEKCVGGRTHRREDSREMWGVKSKVRRSEGKSQKAEPQTGAEIQCR